MAQSGFTSLLLYASGTPGNTPSASNLISGATGAELALNYADGKLYFKNSSGTVQLLASNESAVNSVLTTGSYANPSWITSLAWSKVSSTPTTLTGYGITDAAASAHKYHAFSSNQYFFDNYEQGNYFRLFTENATYSVSRYQAVSNIEYWDQVGSNWVSWSAAQASVEALLDGRQETGMAVEHANRKFRFIVNVSSGWPTRLLYFLHTTWSAITYPSMTVTLESASTVDGAYTLRDTAVFSSANTGNTWGVHARTTSALHTGDTFVRVTIDITDWVDSTTYTTVPLRNFDMLSNYAGSGLLPFSWNYGRVVAFAASPTAPTVAVGTNNTQLATTAFVNAEIANDAPSKTGTGASGTWGISITGNAATVSSITSGQVTTALGFTPENPANKGVANGYASLDASAKVPAAQLPSYVDDVLEYANLAGFPATGETGKIYVALDTNKTYRWSGSAYVEISPSPGSTDAVTEGSTNLYFTNTRARNAISVSGSLGYNSGTGVISFTDAVTSVAGKTGAVTLTNSDVGLGNVENKSSATIRGELTSGNVTTALGYTPYNSTNPNGYITSSGVMIAGGSLGNPADWDTVTTPGNYTIATSPSLTGTSNPGGYPYGTLIVTADGSRVTQTYIRHDSGNTKSFRNKFNASDWQPWVTALTSSNYNSYSPTLTGTGASGTWGISITGNAATATSADQIDGWGFRNTGSNAAVNADTIESNGISYYTSGVTNFSGNSTDGALYSQAYSSSWQHQIAADYRSGQIALRGKNNGTWQSWRTVLDSSNYTSYSPSLTGSGASGTWSINVTGSAGSVAWGNVSSKPSSIMYYQGFTLDANTMDSNATGFTYSNNAPHTGPVARFSTGGGYDLWLNAPYQGGGSISFRTRNGDNATLNAWRTILTDSNYTSYSPSLTGSGASGTWGINVTGYSTYVNLGNNGATQLLGSAWAGGGGYPGYQFSGGNSRFGFSSTSGLIDVYTDGYFYCGIDTTGANRLVLFEDAWLNSKYFGSDGNVYASASMRAPIFYDQDNTGYYLDPNSTSNSALRIRGGTLHGPNPTWGAYLYVGTDGRPDTNSSICATNGNLHIDCANGYLMYLNYYSGNTIVGTTFQGYTFTDRDDTSYFCNPNGSSQFSLVYANDWFRPQGGSGVYWQTYGRGIRAADSEFSYGNIGTYGDGLNGWRGYGVYPNNCIMMANGSTYGFYNPQWGWMMSSDMNGNTTFGGNVSAYSDLRLKENVRRIDNVIARRDALAEAAIKYERDGRTRIGYGAQTLMESGCGEFVLEADDERKLITGLGTLSVDYGETAAVLAVASKMTDERVAALEKEIAELKKLLAEKYAN